MTACPVHAAGRTRDDYDNWHCRGILRPLGGNPMFHLKVRAFCYVQTTYRSVTPNCHRQPGDARRIPTVYQCASPSGGDLDDFKQAFIQAVHDGWNDKLQLVVLRGRTEPSIRCGIDIEFVDTEPPDAHLRIALLIRPTPPPGTPPELREFRASAGPVRDTRTHQYFDMSVDWTNAAAWNITRLLDTDVASGVPITQNTVAHEFGHYLGIEHTCQRPGADIGWCDPSPYCVNRNQVLQDNLMALGNRIQRDHARPWRRRLRQQHLFCRSIWTGRVL